MANENGPKSVLITGAGGGIGAATARLYAAHGWHVFAVDIKSVGEKLPDGVETLTADISSPAEIDALAKNVSQHLKNGLHALVNNAAIQITKPIVETTAEDWDAVQAVNLRAPFLLTRAFYPQLKQARGAVVHVSSVHALMTSPEIGAYAASKGGLLALTRAMAVEFARDEVRVNAVLPGATDTPMLDAGLDRGVGDGITKLSLKQDLASKVDLKRIATPEEIASVIYFLTDPAQSSYITGQPIVVDGGATAHLSTE
jgi:NAD(P)-dependent dehydrogenase (short-subunit alcohol dehydrogenase family)